MDVQKIIALFRFHMSPELKCINNGCTKEFSETRETLVHHYYPNSNDKFTKTK